MPFFKFGVSVKISATNIPVDPKIIRLHAGDVPASKSFNTSCQGLDLRLSREKFLLTDSSSSALSGITGYACLEGSLNFDFFVDGPSLDVDLLWFYRLHHNIYGNIYQQSFSKIIFCGAAKGWNRKRHWNVL